MERVTLRIPEEQVRAVEALVDDGEYANRSEAIRDAVRRMVREDDAMDLLDKKRKKLARIPGRNYDP